MDSYKSIFRDDRFEVLDRTGSLRKALRFPLFACMVCIYLILFLCSHVSTANVFGANNVTKKSRNRDLIVI